VDGSAHCEGSLETGENPGLEDGPDGDGAVVVRFSATERAFHWAFAVPFLGLLLSGLPLGFPALRGWIAGYMPEIGLRLHLVAAVAWLLAPALVLIVGDRRALAVAASELLVIGRTEWSWLRKLPRWLAGLACDMSGVGRFNVGQKLNGWLIAASSLVFAVTGAILWLGWRGPGLPGAGPPRVARVVLTWSRWLHASLSLAIVLPLLGHVLLATLHPRTRASLRGMLVGTVDADWATAHYPRWTAGLSEDGPTRRKPDSPVPPICTRSTGPPDR
jgi:formate dehydrogenase subunit gamma